MSGKSASKLRLTPTFTIGANLELSSEKTVIPSAFPTAYPHTPTRIPSQPHPQIPSAKRSVKPMVYGVWCMVDGVWCMVYGVWCMVYGVWCTL